MLKILDWDMTVGGGGAWPQRKFSQLGSQMHNLPINLTKTNRRHISDTPPVQCTWYAIENV